MAVTAQEIINEAMETIGVLGVGTTLSGEETDRALRALNTMLDAWNVERALIYHFQDEPFTLPAGVSSRTIGPAGNFNTTRPQRIEWAFLRKDDVDYPLEALHSFEYSTQTDKTLDQGWPRNYYYEPATPLGILRFIPPAQEEFELHLGTWSLFTGFATPQTSVDFPPGYKEALVTNLAVRMAPRYERTVPAEIVSLAVNGKQRVKAMNHEPLTPVSSDAAFLSGGGSAANILRGW